jgi:hypothetical protein
MWSDAPCIGAIMMSVPSLASEKQTCRHPATEYLGSDGVAEFYRCQECRHVIIIQGTQSWLLKLAVSA